MNELLVAAMAQILECEPSEISPTTEFRSLADWDSLAYISAITVIESEFGVIIPDNEFRKFKTIADISDYIRKNGGKSQ